MMSARRPGAKSGGSERQDTGVPWTRASGFVRACCCYVTVYGRILNMLCPWR